MLGKAKLFDKILYLRVRSHILYSLSAIVMYFTLWRLNWTRNHIGLGIHPSDKQTVIQSFHYHSKCGIVSFTSNCWMCMGIVRASESTATAPRVQLQLA